ncbi:MAG: M23 family metallopeptidase, partial [Gemmatimonadota bacterium]
RQIRRVMSAGSDTGEGGVGLPDVPEAEATADAEGSAGDGAPEPGSGWSWPLSQEGFVTRAHREAGAEGSEEHSGLDVAVPAGSYVRAARAGRVEAAGEDPVYGLFVRLRHADGYRSLYGHNRWLFVEDGDSVERDEVIALSGSSGRSTAPHLHFEVTGDEGSIDPERLLEGRAPDAGSRNADTRGDGP